MEIEFNPVNPDSLTDGEDRPVEDDDREVFGDPEIKERRGPLLELPRRKAARLNARLFFRQDDLLRRQLVQWEVNELRRRGVPNVGVRRSADVSYEKYIPSNVTPDSLPAVNKAADICRRLKSLLFTDPPVAEVEPSTWEDEDVDAAEFQTKILENVGDPDSGLDDIGGHREAFDKASVCASGFTHYFVDNRGGGYGPLEVEAHPAASTIDDALERPVPVTDPLTGQPQLDPETLEPVTSIESWPVEEVTDRYVAEDGSLVDDQTQAATRWLPRLRREVLHARNVRMSPHNAQWVGDARGVHLASFMAWGEVKEKWPRFRQLERDAKQGDERKQKLLDEILSIEPSKKSELISRSERRLWDLSKKVKDETLVLILTTYYRVCDEYPRGCYCISLGDVAIAERDEWIGEGPDGEDVPLEIPVTQLKQLSEGSDDPYGVAMMEILGPGNEVRLAIWGHMLDYLEWMGSRKTFVPLHSNIRDNDMRQPTRSIIRILPGGQPFHEEIPEFPRFGAEMWGLISTEQDNASGLQQTAQGVESPSVTSGRQAYAIISQVHAGLSELKQNIERAVRRGWRIQAQLVGQFYDAPQKLKVAGEGGGYKVRRWMGADMLTATDIRVKAGTNTMLAPVQKAQLAERLRALQVMEQETFADVMRGNLGGMVGLQEDPRRQRIRRQLAEWGEGPPQGAQDPSIDPTTGQPRPPQIDPMTGMAAPPPLHPELARIFEPVPADDLPDVALIRLHEIKLLMMRPKYMRKPPWWRYGAELELQRAIMAAMPAPAPAPGADGGSADQGSDMPDDAFAAEEQIT